MFGERARDRASSGFLFNLFDLSQTLRLTSAVGKVDDEPRSRLPLIWNSGLF